MGGDGNTSAHLAGAESVGRFVLGREGSMLATVGRAVFPLKGSPRHEKWSVVYPLTHLTLSSRSPRHFLMVT